MLSIPELASQTVDRSFMQINENGGSHTIILVGSKSVGKSTLIYSFLEKVENPKETMVLEYYFGRKTSQKQEMEKTICHLWEYGGKLDILSDVLHFIPAQGLFYYCVMVDLSKIKSIWSTLETSLQAMKDAFPESCSPEVVIICGKYDLFKNYDSEIKKFILTTIRSVAMIFNAHLCTHSSKETTLAKKMKDIFNAMGFGSRISIKEKNTYFAKPLYIPKGADSWESIGVSSSTLEQVKMRHVSRIASEVAMLSETSGPQRTHPEPVLETLLEAKYSDLRNMGTFDFALDDYVTNLR